MRYKRFEVTVNVNISAKNKEDAVKEVTRLIIEGKMATKMYSVSFRQTKTKEFKF